MRDLWPEVRLGERVDLLVGFPFKSSGFTDCEADLPLVKGSTVQQGYIDWDSAPRWTVTEREEFRRFELIPGDVVLAMDRPWVKAGLKYAWIKRADPCSLLVQRVARLRGRNGLYTEFLRFVVGSPAFEGYVRPIVTGVNVPHISGDQILNYRFRLPPPAAQRSILRILVPYDDLIENNTRRIAILEEMAQALYREWFVNFRFPGHEEVEMVESELGLAPAHWKIAALSEVAQINARSVRKGSEPEKILYLDISSASTGEIGEPIPMEYADAPGRARRIVQHGDVIWSTVRPNRRVYGLVLDPPRDLIVSTGFATVSSDVLPFAYLYCALTTQDFADYLTLRAKGSTYPSVTASDFEEAKILVPSSSVTRAFHDLTGPILKLIEKLRRSSVTLRRSRDLLLPKLISGEIEVPEADDALALAAS